jgi:hypothetical protein
MRRHLVIASMLTLAAVAATARPASAQAVNWNENWVLGVSTGAASASSETGATLGAAVNWGLSSRVGLEASSTWLSRRGANEAVAVAITSQVVVWRREPVSAFARGGVGAFVMTLDTSSADIPEFYRNRIASLPAGSTRAFTDPSLVIGAGVDLRASRHLHVRPSIDFVTVLRDRRTMTVTMAAIQVAYHFESHRITPERAGRR